MARTVNTAAAIANIMRDATSRDFSGGLNVADSELNLTSKYARQLDNLVVGLDGTLDIRQGHRLFADVGGDYPIVNMQFYYRYLVPVTTRGEVFAIDGTGTVSPAWTQSIASGYSPPRTIWPSTDFVVFGEFNGNLIIMDGVNKPLTMDNTKRVDYLADPGSGSNVNVPVGNVCATFANHFFIASGYMLYVSERNSAGTWTGDLGVQFANNFDMRPYVPYGDTEILGLYPFKNYLLVAFREVIIPIQIVENASATPKLNITVAYESVMNNYGAISPRVGQDIGDMTLVCDIAGVSSVNLSNFTRALSPDRPSRLIDPLLQPQLARLDLETMRTGCFSVFDRKASAYALFVPNDHLAHANESVGYIYRYVDRMNIEAWQRWRQNDWHSATRSSEGNIFLSRSNSTKIFVKGDPKTAPIYADYVGEQETFSDHTEFTDHTGFTPISDDTTYSGLPISWAWELPWGDFKHRGITKTLRYIIMDTEGDQEFRCQVFIDDKYQIMHFGEPFSDSTLFTDGTGFVPEVNLPLTPALQLDFIGKDAGGWGMQMYGSSPYGGGNNTALRTLTMAPTKFTTFKLRFTGQSKGPLRFVAITLLYQVGTIRRMPNG